MRLKPFRSDMRLDSLDLERIQDIVRKDIALCPDVLDDAIEQCECCLIVTKCDEFRSNTDSDYEACRSQIKDYKNNLAELLASLLKQKELATIYGEVCVEYKDVLIKYLAEFNFFKELDKDCLRRLLNNNLDSIVSFARSKKATKENSAVLREAYLNNSAFACEIILEVRANKTPSHDELFLPPSLTDEDVNEIFQAYIEGEHSDPHNLNAIVRWRDNWGFKIGPRVRAAAEDALKRHEEAVFNSAQSKLGFGFYIASSNTQKELVRFARNGTYELITYNQKWFRSFRDYPTLLNNLIYLFFIIDESGLLLAPKGPTSTVPLLRTFTNRLRGGYPVKGGFSLEDYFAHSLLIFYDRVLKDMGIRMEKILEWYFNKYLPKEHDVTAFNLSLSKKSCYYDRCANVFKQIERALKCYLLVSKGIQINKSTFKHESFDSFHSLPSKVENKYVTFRTKDDELYKAVDELLRDTPYYLLDDRGNAPFNCLLKQLKEGTCKLDDLNDAEKQIATQLLEGQLVRKRADGTIYAERRMSLVQRLWYGDSIVFPREDVSDRKVLDEMCRQGILMFRNTLLTQREADYFSYYYFNKDFTDAQGLRNRYEHSDHFEENDDNDHKKAYLRGIFLLVQLLLKIEDELVLSSDESWKGCGVDFVDWPIRSKTLNTLDI